MFASVSRSVPSRNVCQCGMARISIVAEDRLAEVAAVEQRS